MSVDDDALMAALADVTAGASVGSRDSLLAALASLDAVVPPLALRARLLERIAALPPIVAQQEPVSGITFAFGSSSPWLPTPIPGVTMKFLDIDARSRRARTLVQLAAGAAYPPHRHEGDEETLVISGAMHIEGRVMMAGDYCIARVGTVHGALTAPEGAIFMAIVCLDDAPVGIEMLQQARMADSRRGRGDLQPAR